jgi:hypothetical protein
MTIYEEAVAALQRENPWMHNDSVARQAIDAMSPADLFELISRSLEEVLKDRFEQLLLMRR